MCLLIPPPLFDLGWRRKVSPPLADTQEDYLVSHLFTEKKILFQFAVVIRIRTVDSMYVDILDLDKITWHNCGGTCVSTTATMIS